MVPCRWPSLAGAFLLEQLTCVRMLRIVAIVRKSVTYTLHFFNALAAESALLLQRRDASKTVRGL